jgi:hypothetical protein
VLGLVFCRSGRRSAKAIETLQSLGVHADLVNVDGGLMAWSQHQASKSSTTAKASSDKLQKTPLMVLLVPAIISFIIITLVALLFLRH